MPYFRLIFCFGLFLICFFSAAQQPKSLDSLRSLVYDIAQDSSSADKEDLALVSQFLNQAKLVRSAEDIIFAYQQLAAINYSLGNSNQALHYYKLYLVELEQLTSYKNYKQQRFENNLYENEIKALTSKIASLEQEKNESTLQQDDLLKKNYWIYLGLKVILTIGALLIFGWLYFKYKKPKKKSVVIPPASTAPTITEVLSAAKDELNLVQTELNLADLLVQEIINHPNESFTANKSIRKKFLIHQPKNMAGGDGLYIAVEKYKTFIAVFDAPGYGAVGGLLSTRIYKLLEELVTEHHILLPNLILNQLELNLLNLFPAGVPFSGGISMAVCLFNSTEKTITYSGANMDLFVVQKGSLYNHKGAAKSLLDSSNTIEYVNSEIDVGRGTNIYLSTKGYWLQKGGHDNKALGKSAFEKTVESLSSQPIIEHEQVLNKIFNDWKGGNEQDDDVLVLGLGF
jgi:hypothetical protein